MAEREKKTLKMINRESGAVVMAKPSQLAAWQDSAMWDVAPGQKIPEPQPTETTKAKA